MPEREPATVEPVVADVSVLDDPALDDRKRRILRAIVTEFIARGEPVGSKRVVEVGRLDCSAATVRNEMAVLEEAGLIRQPHTSAGRVPTDLGYRLFVEELRELGEAGVDGRQRELIDELLSSAHDVDDLLTRTTTALSQLTRLVSLVIAPAVDASRLKLIELVSLSAQSCLLLLVDDTGRVTKRVLELSDPVSEGDLDRVRTVLAEHVRGRRMGEVHQAVAALLDQAPAELRGPLAQVSAITATALTEETLHRIFVSGRATLADEGSFDRDDLSRVLSLLEERSTLARVLDASVVDDGPSVRIGRENEVEDLHSASLVTQRYQLITAGSLGVLGPTRMDYASVLATVRAVAGQLESTLTDLSE